MAATGRRRTAHLVAASALLAGIGLSALALPAAVAGFMMLPGERDFAAVRERARLGEEALARAAASRERALRWSEGGRLWTDLALARLIEAERKSVLRADKDLATVREALVRGLALAPLNSYGWSRLAYLDYAVGGVGPGPAGILPLAILSGPAERGLYLLRAELGLRLWPEVAEADRPLLLRQLELAWQRDPFRTLDAARAAERVELLRRALAGAPDQAVILEKLLARGT